MDKTFCVTALVDPDSSDAPAARSFSAPRSRRNKKFVIQLTAMQREELDRIVMSKTCSHRDHVRASAMLLADECNHKGARTDEEIAKVTHLSVRTIETLRRRFVEQGLTSAVSWRKLPEKDLPTD